jgi:hypothetical protein
MPLQRVLAVTANGGDLGEQQADGTGRPDGLDLQPTGNENWKFCAVAGALAANDCASAGLAMCGGAARGAGCGLGVGRVLGAVAAGFFKKRGGSACWA